MIDKKTAHENLFAWAAGLCYHNSNRYALDRVVHIRASPDYRPAGLICLV